MVVFSYSCVLHFLQHKIGQSSEMQFGALRLQTWTNIQPHIAWWKLKLCPHFFVLCGIHTTWNYFSSKGQCSLCPASSQVIWLIKGGCFLHAGCLRSRYSSSLSYYIPYQCNSQMCDNFELQRLVG